MGFVVSHPFHGEAVKWMGHGRVVVNRIPQRNRLRGCGWVFGVGSLVAHPSDKDRDVARVGHPRGLIWWGPLGWGSGLPP
jgi:hypothetical protein